MLTQPARFNESKSTYYLSTIAIFILLFLTIASFSTDEASQGFYAKYFLITGSLSTILLFAKILKKRNLKVNINILLAVPISIALAISNLVISKENASSSINLFITCILALLIITSLVNYRDATIYALKIFIITNIAFLIFQIAYTLFTLNPIYIHGQLFSFSRQSYALTELGSYYRFSGYHLEPGSYATLLSITVVIYKLISSKYDKFTFAATISILMTISAIGVILFTLLALDHAFSAKKSKKNTLQYSLLLIIFTITLGSALDINSYIAERFSSGIHSDNSSSYKLDNFKFIYSQPAKNIIIGNGIDANPADCFSCQHMKGNGAISYYIFSFGIIITIPLLLIISYYSINNHAIIVPVLIFLIFRESPMQITHWLLLLCIMMFPKKNKKIDSGTHIAQGGGKN